jgi:hypothetical protein
MVTTKDRDLVVAAFDRARYPSGSPTLNESWLGIYQVLLWYEGDRLHIKEANDLRKNKRWQELSARAEQFISNALGVDTTELPVLVDQMMKLPRWADVEQRNNPLGNGLRTLMADVLRRWGNPKLEYRQEERMVMWFPGMQLPGRSSDSKIDVLAVHPDQPRAVISCKWSYRHDRISDVTNECQEYKGAAVRRQNMHLGYYLFTTEFDGQRLDKVLNQPCVDALVHVHLPLALHLLDGGTLLMTAARGEGRLLDLAEFIRATHGW